MTTQKLKGKLARWSLLLQEYDFKVEHRAGTNNANAQLEPILARIERWSYRARLDKGGDPSPCNLPGYDGGRNRPFACFGRGQRGLGGRRGIAPLAHAQVRQRPECKDPRSHLPTCTKISADGRHAAQVVAAGRHGGDVQSCGDGAIGHGHAQRHGSFCSSTKSRPLPGKLLVMGHGRHGSSNG